MKDQPDAAHMYWQLLLLPILAEVELALPSNLLDFLLGCEARAFW